ncbi:MAG: hypothetical protein FWC20_05440 [Oscillospiraceae bacterium]|nr:hypothetical protein [Oscillospiraceae bacterium]
MVKLIMGQKGSGKTKQLISLINEAVDNERGDIVCIERVAKLTYDIPHKVRLIDASQYGFDDYSFLRGFISGLHSANYDITHIFIDNVLGIVKRDIDEDSEEFFEWCDNFSAKERVKFTFTLSVDISKATERIIKFL